MRARELTAKGGSEGCRYQAVVNAERRQRILDRYQLHSRQMEQAAYRHHHGETASEEATSRQRWADLDLTKRELEVLQLIANGHATQEIARQLFIAEETVKSHVRNLLARMQARSRSQAVAMALRRRLID
jgi:DNA-binding NarL/FixJ family response regulator